MTSPRLRQFVFDAVDARALAEFYRQLLGFSYRPGDEPPPAGEPDPHAADWLVLRNPEGGASLAFQPVEALPAATWPDGPVPQQAADPRLQAPGDRAGARVGGQVQTVAAAVPGQLGEVLPRPAGQILRQMADVLVTVVPRGDHVESVRQLAFGAVQFSDRQLQLHGTLPVGTTSVTAVVAGATPAGPGGFVSAWRARTLRSRAAAVL